MELFKIFGTIAVNNSEANSSIDETQSKASSFADKLSAKFTNVGETISKFGDNVANVGKSMTAKVSVPLTALGTLSVKTAASFEDGMLRVKALSGATDEEYKKLTEKAKELGRTTAWTASDVAEAMQYMALAGYNTNDILGSVGGMLSLASASGEELSTVTDILTDSMSAFGDTALDSARYADVLATTQAKSNTTVGMLGEAMKYVAPIAGTMEMKLEDVSLAIGLMANNGIKGSQAGTSLKTSLARLADPTKDMEGAMVKLGLATATTTKELDNEKIKKAQVSLENKTIALEKAQIKYNDAVKKYGEESSQAKKAMLDIEKAENNLSLAQDALEKAQQGKIKTGIEYSNVLLDSHGKMKSLRDILTTLRESFSKLSKDEQLSAASALFGKEAMSGMLAIINSSDEDFNKLAKAIDGSNGSAEDMAEEMESGLGGSIRSLKSALEGVTITIGERLAPKVETVAEKIKEFTVWFQSLDETTQDNIVKFGLFLVALGPVLIIVGKITSGIGSVIGVVGKLGSVISGAGSAVSSLGGVFGALASPVGIIIAAIGALVAVFIYLWNTNEDFRNSVMKIWNDLKATFDEVGKAIVDMLNSMGFNFKDFGEVMSALWKGFMELLGPVFIGIINNVVNHIKTALDIVLGIVKFFTSLLKGDWQGCWDAIKSILAAALNGLLAPIANILKVLKDMINVALGWLGTSISGVLTSIGTKIIGKLQDFKNKVKETIENIKSTIKNGIDKIKGFFNFKWELPKIKMPHFKIDGKFSINPPSVPKFKVDWYKKAMNNPMIMNSPTAFGINKNGQIMAGGEAGSEVVSGTDTLMQMIQDAVDSKNARLEAILQNILAFMTEYMPQFAVDSKNARLEAILQNILAFMTEYMPQFANMQVVMDSGVMVGELAPGMDVALGRLAARSERGVR